MGFMYELYNGKLFYPGGNAKMIKTSSLCYIVQTNEKKMSYEILKRDDEGVPGTKVSIKIPLQYNYNLN